MDIFLVSMAIQINRYGQFPGPSAKTNIFETNIFTVTTPKV